MYALRVLQFVLAAVVLGLVGYVTSWWTKTWRTAPPPELTFILFKCAWTLLILPPLVLAPIVLPHVFRTKRSKFLLLLPEILTMLYWFAGWVSMTVFLTDRICFGTVCSIAKAGTAVSAVEWFLWCGTAVLGGLWWAGMWGWAKEGEGGKEEKRVDMHQGV
ncbi:hypothetical protein GQ43DRAFT_369414 [Delitschia confertaspora ATCC 74209]|uniref:MARVEL domain-containing protein n=1 Tax=Delitschia confertaspora ATCC 74209 TaxID=1513339 RepID=A0A9P4MTA2_9PLEO|nr:hypothetical protein GQ43DRAFT_369414 [Delitschia confertaspora ATCC 74209]